MAFGDSISAVQAVNGIYATMDLHSFFEWSGISYEASRSADEVIYKGGVDDFAADSLLYTNGDVYTMWQQGFASLLAINTNISGLQGASWLGAALQHQLLGEMYFCRAFENFYLVNLWGDGVPLLTTPDVDINQTAKSASRQQVYNQIIADLLQAQQDLTASYPIANRARPNALAATALLARVYLYQGSNSDAITQATTVINSNLYSPLPPLAQAFLTTSEEVIWQLAVPSDGHPDPVGDVLLYRNTPSTLTPQLLAAFEPGDGRLLTWVTTNMYNGTTYTIPNKYKRPADTSSLPLEYEVVLRLAEQYLIRAEANTRLEQTAAAVADLNVVRARAGVPALSDTLTQAQCIAAVEHERQVELFSEWGHRWFDLKRWPGITNPALTRADEVLGAYKPGWKPTDQYYPIPQTELKLDPNLVQNPGYPAH